MGTDSAPALKPRLHLEYSETSVEGTIRERLAMERQRLDALAPEVLDLAAEVLQALHAGLCGQMSALRGDRTERYRRGQLIGENSLPIEDFVFLLAQGGERAVGALDLLAAALGFDLVPEDQPSETVTEANADLMRDLGEFEARLGQALASGVLTVERRAELLQPLRRMVQDVGHLEPALRGGRP
ncbi:MAG: hypothetical protein ABR961_03210 [Thermoanaerobaculaceae bacterium]|jgi:hypothetical protein